MTKKMLSLPGGGIRGVVQARILDHIEKATSMPIATMFDLVAGCSTGGILAAILNRESNGKPTYSASDVVDLYVKHGPAIFYRTWWAPAAIFKCKYDGVELKNVLQKYLGEARLSECLNEVAITAYDLVANEPYIFKRFTARSDASQNYLLWEAALATASAPTYFPPYLNWVDGGVFSTDPGMVCLDEAYTLWPEVDRSEFYLLSIGNGFRSTPIDPKEAQGWGQISWASPVVACLTDGNARNVAHNLRTFMGGSFDFYQAPIRGDVIDPSMDAASPSNIAALIKFADDIWSSNRAAFDKTMARICG